MLEILWGLARFVWGILELTYEFFGGGSDRVRKKREKKRLEQEARESADHDRSGEN